jgi:predicted ATPase
VNHCIGFPEIQWGQAEVIVAAGHGAPGRGVARLLRASADAATMIGTANGRGIAAHDGLSQTIPWSSRIAVPAGPNVPGAVW